MIILKKYSFKWNEKVFIHFLTNKKEVYSNVFSSIFLFIYSNMYSSGTSIYRLYTKMNLENVRCGEKMKSSLIYSKVQIFSVISRKLFETPKNILYKTFTIKLPLFIHVNNIFEK